MSLEIGSIMYIANFLKKLSTYSGSICYETHFQMDIQKLEDEHNLKFRGFREVIDLLSSSHKPIISYNCLNGR